MCRKFAYLTLEDAEESIRHTNANLSNPIVLTKAYECKYCGNFHTTSKGQKNEALIKAKAKNYAEIEYWNKKLKIKNP